MRIDVKQTAIKFRQVSSFLLLLLFCSVTLVTAFHDHENDPQRVVVKDQDSIGLQDSCLVCAYLLHHQAEHALMVYPQVMFRPVLADIYIKAACSSPQLTPALQTFINKGPPLLS